MNFANRNVPLVQWQVCDSASQQAIVLAGTVARHLQLSLERRPCASLIVPGGRTPAAFLNQLAHHALAWKQVHVTLSDERWVDPASRDANARLVRECLLTGFARDANFIPLKSDVADPAAAVEERFAALAVMPRPLDVVVLGMGEDGHVASLFPGASNLGDALNPDARAALVAIRAPVAPPHRISFNLAALLDARYISIMIQGHAKRSVIERAIADASFDIGPGQLPVTAVLRQHHVPVEIHWTP